MQTPDWMRQGKCWGMDEKSEMFFPSLGQSTVHAQRFCEDCPVKDECLEYAIANDIDHGVWGGASERQRRKIKAEMRRRGLVAVAA